MPADDDLTHHLDEILSLGSGWKPKEGEARWKRALNPMFAYEAPESAKDVVGPIDGESAQVSDTPDVVFSDRSGEGPPSPFFNDRGEGIEPEVPYWPLADTGETPEAPGTVLRRPSDDGGFLPTREVDFRDMPGLDTEGIPYRPFIMESPVQALDMHLSHWAWMGSQSHIDATETFLYSYYGPDKGEPPEQAIRQFIKQESDWLHAAVTHYVDPDVADMVEQMGQAMPPDMLRVTDVPMRDGFVVFGKPWEYLNFHMNTYIGKIPIRAIAWKITNYVGQPVQNAFDPQTFKPGVYLMLYTDKAWLNHIRTENAPPEYSAPLVLSDLWGWTFDTWWQDIDEDDTEAVPDQHHASLHVGEMRRKLLALWRFMDDEIVRTERARMPRPALRRWSRTKKDIPEDGSIVSIHLRRIKMAKRESVGEEGAAPEWSHRWWVRGHYRYNPKTDQKDIWVRPHLKGPDGLPIVLKEKLISVDR